MSPARLVRLRLEREAHVVALIAHMAAEEVERLAEALESVDRRLGRPDFAAFPSAPEHIHRRPELSPEIDRTHRLLDRESPHGGIVGREGAVLEDRVREQVRRRHRHADAAVVERRAEAPDDRVALGRRRAERHEVVVVQADAVRSQRSELAHALHGVERGARRLAERVAPDVAHGPETEGEAMLGPWFVIRHAATPEREGFSLRRRVTRRPAASPRRTRTSTARSRCVARSRGHPAPPMPGPCPNPPIRSRAGLRSGSG